MSMLSLFVTCPRGVESLLVAELQTLGASAIAERRGGVACEAPLETAYHICLWSRLASRVLMPLTRFETPDADALYQGALEQDWPALFAPSATMAIEVAGRSQALTHTHYAALKVKDAVVDRFRDAGFGRPDIDTERPDIRIHLHLDKTHATLSLDLAGDALHRRGYRRSANEAPLKENLAAALLIAAGWPAMAAQGAPLFDPMCGSGTLLIEAALIAADIAPGLQRPRWGFKAWSGHDGSVWQQVIQEARARRDAGLLTPLPQITGSDLDPKAIAIARANITQAGLDGKIDVQVGDALAAKPAGIAPGLWISNPPYGERLGEEAELIKLYSLLGVRLKQHFGGWTAALFTARGDLGPRLGLSAPAMHAFYNGAIACKLLVF